MSYKVIRFFFNGDRKVIKTGLTLEEAKEHCNDPETSSKTCTKAAGRNRTLAKGEWFDGYDAEA
jgi:hypothetical protein